MKTDIERLSLASNILGLLGERKSRVQINQWLYEQEMYITFKEPYIAYGSGVQEFAPNYEHSIGNLPRKHLYEFLIKLIPNYEQFRGKINSEVVDLYKHMFGQDYSVWQAMLIGEIKRLEKDNLLKGEQKEKEKNMKTDLQRLELAKGILNLIDYVETDHNTLDLVARQHNAVITFHEDFEASGRDLQEYAPGYVSKYSSNKQVNLWEFLHKLVPNYRVMADRVGSAIIDIREYRVNQNFSEWYYALCDECDSIINGKSEYTEQGEEIMNEKAEMYEETEIEVIKLKPKDRLRALLKTKTVKNIGIGTVVVGVAYGYKKALHPHVAPLVKTIKEETARQVGEMQGKLMGKVENLLGDTEYED